MSGFYIYLIIAITAGLILGFQFGSSVKQPSAIRSISMLRTSRRIYLATGIIAAPILCFSLLSYLQQPQIAPLSDLLGSLLSLLVWSAGIGQAVGFMMSNVVIKPPEPRFKMKSGEKVPIDVIDPTTADLATLRRYEWLWRNPLQPLPLGLVRDRIVDKVTLGWLSLHHLNQVYSRFVWQIVDARFAWECSAIAINSTLAQAYAMRAVDAAVISNSFSRSVQRLQGWDTVGNEIIYDFDCALVDIAISLQLRPNWEPALFDMGKLSWQKALTYVQCSSEWRIKWLRLAKDCLLKSVQSHEFLEDSTRVLDEVEKLIALERNCVDGYDVASSA